MEALSNLAKKAMLTGLYKGLRCNPTGPILSHLIYADDVVFLGEWSQFNAKSLKRLLRCCYLISGLKANLNKCNLFGIGIEGNEIQEMAVFMNCKTGSFPFKFLGLPIGSNVNLRKSWDLVIDIFKKRLSPWRVKSLSYGGRITLIKSVLNSLPSYYFSLYRAPESVITSLERLRREFFWGGTEEKSALNWVAWQKVISPESHGGVGLGSLKNMNLPLSAKWWWRFKIDIKGLWRKVIWGIHSSSRSWKYIPLKLSFPGTWKQIAKAASLLAAMGLDIQNSIKAVIGNGKLVRFWLDRWHDSLPLAVLYPDLFSLEARKECLISDRVIISDFGLLWNWQWTTVPSSVVERMQLQSLSQITLPLLADRQDRWLWTINNSSQFSVSSIKEHLINLNSSIPVFVCSWNNWVPKRVGILAWRAADNRIPVRVELERRNIVVPTLDCPVCGYSPESVDHIFIGCGFAQEIWSSISQWCNVPQVFAFSIRDLPELHKFYGRGKRRKKVFHGIILATIWCIWRNRSARVFQGVEGTLENIVNEIKARSYLWIKNRGKLSSINWKVW